MKSLIKILLFILLLAALGGSIASRFFNLTDFSLTAMWQRLSTYLNSVSLKSSQVNQANIPAMQTNSPQFTKIYKWQDAQGTWHYSDTQTAAASQTMYINPNANVLHLEPVPTPTAEAKIETTTESAPNYKDTFNSLAFPSTIPLDQVPQLIEQAQQVQGLLDNRQQHYDQLLNEQGQQ